MKRPDAVPDRARQEGWLKRYYFTRAAFSIAWVLALVATARSSPIAGAILLVCYPAWDAAANFLDGRRSGGLAVNRTQLVNLVVSGLVALLLALVVPDMHQVFAVFGLWAILSGLLQLRAAQLRWTKNGAQWAMILSGAQSALAGAFFLAQARMPVAPPITVLAGYAGFGAFYFLLSALLLARRSSQALATRRSR
ncbi:DUF308 domain-containing protein [Massilia sp. Mn16-1_5]|uniref:DUF308 domain-containing protein n=1 Tax=Massilia sp. Mn16-1_5 TaxID=2079199 RepID=UPI00109EA064|nr:DUF308 domain-containing protein [Massilia sp. Mn16-1_5]THC45306.1 hypothetical protein C2862_05885 [Massilia sp. Mn16-1_5]